MASRRRAASSSKTSWLMTVIAQATVRADGAPREQPCRARRTARGRAPRASPTSPIATGAASRCCSRSGPERERVSIGRREEADVALTVGRRGVAPARAARTRGRRVDRGRRRPVAERHVRRRRAGQRPPPAGRRRRAALRADADHVRGPGGGRRALDGEVARAGGDRAHHRRADAGAGRALPPHAGGDAFAVPATNKQIADELFLSVEAVKSHLRPLFEKFALADLPQNAKRAALVERALTLGIVTERDLRAQ